MRRVPLFLSVLLAFGCAHGGASERQPAPQEPTALDEAQRSTAHVPKERRTPASSHALAAALKKKGALAQDAPPTESLNGAVRRFQKAEGLAETGFPDRETLRLLGLDPDTLDETLDTTEVNRGDAQSLGL